MISDKAITNYVPVYKAEDSALITQYEMKNAERAGLVKFDFLGLKTLTIIDKAVAHIRADVDADFQLADIPFDDKKVYREIGAGHTTGIFQLESRGMTQLLIRLRPTVFADIVAVIALFRPGPLGSGMVDDFIRCKNKEQKETYLLPQLGSILCETYGIIVYQEQVQKIAATLANYTLGEADLLRRAMGKKKPAEMAKQKTRFVDGCCKNDISEKDAVALFELMEKFAEYGFNKSHSTAYGYISYQTAYLKVNYPAQYMSALLTYDYDHAYKSQRYIRECQRLGVKVAQPSINTSVSEFTPVAKNKIRYGLVAVKGLGSYAVEHLLANRHSGEKFSSIPDMMKRVDLMKVGKKNLEILVDAGCFDEFAFDRRQLQQQMGKIAKRSGDYFAEKDAPQMSLFASFDNNLEPFWQKLAIDTCCKHSIESLLKERGLLGDYLAAHPLDYYKSDRDFLRIHSLASFDRSGEVEVLALLRGVSTRFARTTGKQIVFLTLEDSSRVCEDVLLENEETPLPPVDTPVVVMMRKFTQQGRKRLLAKQVRPLHEIRTQRVKRLALTLAMKGEDIGMADKLLHSLADIFQNKGDTPVDFHLICDKQNAIIANTRVKVNLNDSLVMRLQMLPHTRSYLKFS